MKLIRNSYCLALFVALIAFGVQWIAISEYIEFRHNTIVGEKKDEARKALALKKTNIEKSLYSRIYYTKGVSAYVSTNPDISSDDFQQLTQKLIGDDNVIHTMSLAPNAIISSVYPPEGHESVIGLNLLEHPDREEIVRMTINTHKIFIAGPVSLVEGGIAFISYNPIFVDSISGQKKFWGITDIVIKQDSLLKEAGLNFRENGLQYSLRGADGQGSDGRAFWGDEEVFLRDFVAVDIALPTGSWQLAAMPAGGWASLIDRPWYSVAVLYLIIIFISLLIAMLARLFYNIRANELELKAIFGAMRDVVIEFNSEAVYTKIAPTNNELLYKPKHQLLGKSVYDIFPHETANMFYNAIQESIRTREVVEIVYPLTIRDNDLWFIARISYIDEDRIMYIAHDYTQRKKIEEELKNSSQRLKELNATKDKFFSIIAHDLRNPLGSYKNLSSLLVESYSELSEEDKLMMLGQLAESSTALYSLLENLLDWSRSQRGSLKFTPQEYDLYYVADNVISTLRAQAAEKNIRIENRLPQPTGACFDVNMIITVLRNLVSNAIKYTVNNGTIVIHLADSTNPGQHTIHVSDNGIGIAKETIEQLFRIDKHISTNGTAEEKGSGLGLILCHEFITRHKGAISVSSPAINNDNNLDQPGSTFTFTLPIRCKE